MQGVITMSEWKFFMILLSVVGVIIGGLVWLVAWATMYREIFPEQYTTIHYWSKNLPEIRLMVETATWEDNKINFSEYREIEEAAIPLLILDARGDNDVHE